MTPLRQIVQRSIPTAATTDIPIGDVETGDVWRVTHVALSDDAAGDITVVFGVTDIVGFHPLTGKHLVSTGDTAWDYVELILGEEDTLVARVTTSAGAGQVTFVALGEIIGPPPETPQVGGGAVAG